MNLSEKQLKAIKDGEFYLQNDDLDGFFLFAKSLLNDAEIYRLMQVFDEVGIEYKKYIPYEELEHMIVPSIQDVTRMIENGIKMPCNFWTCSSGTTDSTAFIYNMDQTIKEDDITAQNGVILALKIKNLDSYLNIGEQTIIGAIPVKNIGDNIAIITYIYGRKAFDEKGKTNVFADSSLHKYVAGFGVK